MKYNYIVILLIFFYNELIMNAIYPFTSSILKLSENFNNNIGSYNGCINHDKTYQKCEPNALFGSHKPAFEGSCTDGCTNLWNNSTKRKGIVYKEDSRNKVVTGLGSIGFDGNKFLNNKVNYHLRSNNEEKKFIDKNRNNFYIN